MRGRIPRRLGTRAGGRWGHAWGRADPRRHRSTPSAVGRAGHRHTPAGGRGPDRSAGVRVVRRVHRRGSILGLDRAAMPPRSADRPGLDRAGDPCARVRLGRTPGGHFPRVNAAADASTPRAGFRGPAIVWCADTAGPWFHGKHPANLRLPRAESPRRFVRLDRTTDHASRRNKIARIPGWW